MFGRETSIVPPLAASPFSLRVCPPNSAMSRRMNTYKKSPRNSPEMNTYKIIGLKVALLTSSMIPRAPQAIEVVGEAEQQGLANLRCQAAPRSARRKLAFDHRENSFHLRAWPIVFLWKGPVHLVPKGSLGNAPARVGWDDTPRAQALSNVLVGGFGIELGIRQHHSDGYASSCRIHQPRQSPCVAPRPLPLSF